MLWLLFQPALALHASGLCPRSTLISRLHKLGLSPSSVGGGGHLIELIMAWSCFLSFACIPKIQFRWYTTVSCVHASLPGMKRAIGRGPKTMSGGFDRMNLQKLA